MIDFKKLTDEQKKNLHWMLNFLENRSLTNSEIKKHTNMTNDDTVWISIHDVSGFLINLFGCESEFLKFRAMIETHGLNYVEKKIFKGELSKFATEEFHN